MRVAAIVLAAGEAKRMGGQKLRLPFGEATIIETVIGSVIASGVAETIVVLGHRADEIAPLAAKFPVKTVLNPAYRAGMSTSIIAGVKAVSAETQAVVLALGDQPAIGAGIIGEILDGYARGEKGIALPVHDGRRGHPVVISLQYRDELLALRGDTGARDIVATHAEDVLEVPVDSAGIYADVDTAADYRALRRRGAH